MFKFRLKVIKRREKDDGPPKQTTAVVTTALKGGYKQKLGNL